VKVQERKKFEPKCPALRRFLHRIVTFMFRS